MADPQGVNAPVGPYVTGQVPGQGEEVWLGVSQTVLVTMAASQAVLARDVARTGLEIVVVSTSLAAAATTVAFTVRIGGAVPATTAAVTSWVVPGTQTFRVVSVQAVVQTSAVANLYVTVAVLSSTALPANNGIAMAANVLGILPASGTVMYGYDLNQDIPGGVTVGVGVSLSATVGLLTGAIVVGYLFP